MPGYARSLQKGTSPALRAIVNAATVDNAVPVANSTGSSQMLRVGTMVAIDIVAAAVGAGSTFDLNVWWWYEAAELWVLDSVIGTRTVTAAGGPVALPILNSPRYQCADAFYVRVFNFAGVGATATIWAAGRPAAAG